MASEPAGREEAVLDEAPDLDEAEQIRREFARTWGRSGAAWGVPGSTAAVQGYLLMHGGPLTRSEIRAALGLSHRAVLMALADCEAWGIAERAPEKRRAGARGPAGTAWVPVEEHFEWFRRVAGARKARETDPVLPLLDDCLRRADAAGAEELRDRIASLLRFVHRFDHAVTAIVGTEAASIDHLFAVLDRLDDETLARLLETLADIPADDLARAAEALSAMSAKRVGRIIALVARPGVARLMR